MATNKIARTVYCDVREGSLISQSAPYSSELDWQEVVDIKVQISNYYQADWKVQVVESQLALLLECENCYIDGMAESISHPVFFKRFYKRFHSSFRLHRRLGELQNFDKQSFPILGDVYKWEWAKYLAQQIFGHTLEG
jgi:hypothetical protein